MSFRTVFEELIRFICHITFRIFLKVEARGRFPGNAVVSRKKQKTLQAYISGTAAWILKILSRLNIVGLYLSIQKIKKNRGTPPLNRV